MFPRTSRPRVICLASLMLLTVSAAAGLAPADQIVLKNGDRITGTIQSADEGNLVILSPIAGTITVALSDVKTFSTDGPVKIILDDGTVINQPVTPGADGAFETSSKGLLAVQSVPISKIDKINPPPIAWHGSLGVNASLAQGDTYSEQFGVNAHLVRRGEIDRIEAKGEYLFGKQKVNGVTSTSTDQWYFEPSYNYFVNKELFVLGDVRVEKNRIEHLDIRVTPNVGVGWQIVETPDFNADVQGGLAWVYEDYTNIGTPGENVSLRLAYHIDKTFWAPILRVFSDCAYYPSVQNTADYLVLFDAGLRLALTKTMYSELKTEVDYDSHPAPNSHRTQTQIILGVGWTF